MFVVICYDIEDDGRRTQVHKALKAFGENVQESVFEAIVDEQQLKRMQEKVKQLIEGHDKVRYYILCEGCQQKISGTRGHPSALLLRRWIV
jgi:CRISPR-associated protein Cas2